MGAQSIAHQTAPPGVALFDAADRVLGFQTNVPSDYSTPRLYRDVQLAVRDGRVLFMPGTAGEAWGVAQPLICMSLPSNAPMTTNLIPFPWNAVTINAHEVTDAKFVHDDRQNANFVVIKAKVGVNRFEYLFRPDRTWVVLSGFSFLAMLAVIPLSLRGFLIGDPQQPTRREEPLAD